MMEDHPCHLCAHRATTSILGLGSSPRPLPIQFIYGFTARYRTRISIGKNSFISRSAISFGLANRFDAILSFVPGNKNSISRPWNILVGFRKGNGLEIRRSVLLAVEIHARRFPVSTTSPYQPRKLEAARETYSWCLARGMHDYE